MTVTRERKFVWTVVLFALGAVLVLAAGAVHGVAPLFLAWIPLLTVPWLLTRPEPGDPPPAQTAAEDSPPEEAPG
ncbi:MAG TPA: hypothetical protein VKA30_05530 [Actinomycetota bacterium]|nr:hypothetical protein [Actinomycetota bacterium]